MVLPEESQKMINLMVQLEKVFDEILLLNIPDPFEDNFTNQFRDKEHAKQLIDISISINNKITHAK